VEVAGEVAAAGQDVGVPTGTAPLEEVSEVGVEGGEGPPVTEALTV